MVKEDYVSFEIAKLLKEKGFDENTSMVYMSYGELRKLDRYDSIRNSNYNDITKNYFEYTAPTLQMAMKWLREEKHIFIELLVDTMIKGAFTWRLFEYPSLEIMPYDGWEYTYEKACEVAIKYCLENLI